MLIYFHHLACYQKVLQKLQEDQAQGILIAPLWKTQTWFPKMLHMLIAQPVLLPKDRSLLQLPHNRTVTHPLWPKLRLMACFLSGDDSKSKKFQGELVKVTTKQYRVYLDKWTRHASQRNQDPNTPTVANIIDFLTDLYDSGMSYSAINTARSALSAAVELSYSTLSIGEYPLIRRFVKGTYQIRPPNPRYNSIWDIRKVLDLLKIWSLLTLQLVMLCMLVTGQSCQSIHMMDIKHISKTESSYIFCLEEHIKQSKSGKRNPEIVQPAFPADKRLCAMTCFDAYIAKTETVRNTQNTRLFLSYTKHYHSVTKNTLSRWVKYVMKKSGIDINTFGPHSTRSASTSAALRSGVPLDVIMKVSGWSTKFTFARFLTMVAQS